MSVATEIVHLLLTSDAEMVVDNFSDREIPSELNISTMHFELGMEMLNKSNKRTAKNAVAEASNRGCGMDRKDTYLRSVVRHWKSVGNHK